MKNLIALLLLLPVLASADPGSATKYLMNEPASLMDVAILRLSINLDLGPDGFAALANHEIGNGKIIKVGTLTATYDFASDEILINTRLLYLGNATSEHCSAVIAYFRTYFFLNMEESFSHAGYKLSNQPTDLIKDLKERVRLTCVLSDMDEIAKPITVKSTLSSEELFISNGAEND